MQTIYLFDFDGTLVDSMDTWAGVYIKLLEEHNIPYPEDIVKIITPLGNAGASAYCISLGLSMTVEEVQAHNHEILLREYSQHIQAKSNVIPVLKQLKERGCSLNVLTASPHRYVDPCLKRLGILDWFDNNWSIDDFGHAKSEPIIYEKAAARLGVTVKDCLFLDDNLIALQAVKESGMIAVGVHDKSSDSLTNDIKAVVDRYIYDFEELL